MRVATVCGRNERDGATSDVGDEGTCGGDKRRGRAKGTSGGGYAKRVRGVGTKQCVGFEYKTKGKGARNVSEGSRGRRMRKSVEGSGKVR